MLRFNWKLAAVLTLLAASGCGQNPYGTHSVTGTITLDGQPLPSARVMFSPTAGRPSSAITDEQGHYELHYIRDIMGAEAGQHSVSITTEAEPFENGQYPPERIPRHYNAATTLTANVEEGTNEINFELQSKKR